MAVDARSGEGVILCQGTPQTARNAMLGAQTGLFEAPGGWSG